MTWAPATKLPSMWQAAERDVVEGVVDAVRRGCRERARPRPVDRERTHDDRQGAGGRTRRDGDLRSQAVVEVVISGDEPPAVVVVLHVDDGVSAGAQPAGLRERERLVGRLEVRLEKEGVVSRSLWRSRPPLPANAGEASRTTSAVIGYEQLDQFSRTDCLSAIRCVSISSAEAEGWLATRARHFRR